MRLCEQALNFVQIIDYKGTVRICPWQFNNIIGTLSESTMWDIWHGKRADEVREKLISGDYSDCFIDACPFLAMNDIENHMIEIDKIPDYPEALYLGFEKVCNYQCTSCTTPDIMRCNQSKIEEIEKGYQLIENRLKDVLPHVKYISANGLGELFVSKHILNILSNWHPLSPKEQCRVELESNGSLFDAKHWEQISNLGQYHLSVSITVMSFDEKIYQILSGTNLPISQIEDNLRFIKKLREQGVINYLELATVYQERNFRRLPEFARRCVEEFGADYVRLRPYTPQGKFTPDIEWFTDVRGKYHPYHQEFLEVMKDPIFKHPKVHDWGGGLDSSLGELPSKQRADAFEAAAHLSEKRAEMLNQYRDFCANLLSNKHIIEKLMEVLQERTFILYGLGKVGKEIANNFKDNKLVGILDNYSKLTNFCDIPIFSMTNAPLNWHEYDILITPLTDRKEIPQQLKEHGFSGEMIDVYDIITNL